MGEIEQRLVGEEKSMMFKKLVSEDFNGESYINLSFRFFFQRDSFGLKGQSNSWFISLIDRIKDFSGKTTNIIENYTERDRYRLHPIDWKSKKIPIQIDDLTSIPTKIREYAESVNDFFWQFQLSKSTGRVLGFFSPDHSTFYVVLLDPKHNAQPSADFGYRVDDTEIALTEYENLKFKFASIEESVEKCKLQKISCPAYKTILQEHLSENLCYIAVDEELRDKYKCLFENGKFRNEFESFLFEKYTKEPK